MPMTQQNSNNGRNGGQYFERRGQQVTRRIATAVARKSWKWTLLNLAWTVGPVTFIALQIGSYVGLGKTAPKEIFVYFAVYTLVAGFLAMIGSILHDAFYKPRVQLEQNRLLEVIDKLFSLRMAVRDMILEELEPNERRIMSAYHILNGAGIHPSAIGTAVHDLTQNDELSEWARRIDVFAEQGMQSRIDDEWPQIEASLEEVRQHLEPVAPQAYQLLKNRMRGIAPLVQHGIERSDGFIDRTLLAADAEDESLMTLNDAYELLTLAFELLNGRRIAMLDTRFQGDRAFEKAQVALDEARQHYRKALRARNNRIRLLAERLYQETGADAIADAADSMSRLVAMMKEGLQQLDPAEQTRYRRYYEEEIYRRHRAACQRYENLQRAERAYRKIWQRDGAKMSLRLQSKTLRQNGFVIDEHEITLTDSQKVRFARDLDKLLADVEIRTGRRLVVYDTSHENRMMRFVPEDYKQLAMGVAHFLDELIDLSQPEEQLAIESSNMGNFASLDMDLSPQTKAGWAATIVEALHQNRRKASHRLARNLVRFYRITLSDEMIDYFVSHFGADQHYLEHLNLEADALEDAVESHLPAAPLALPKWRKLFDDPYKLAAYSS